MRKFVISDIHGCSNTFKALLQKISFEKEDVLFILGDMINKGPDSKGVVDYIMDKIQDGFIIHCLRGNHEEVFYESSVDKYQTDFFLRMGGDVTLMSFEVAHFNELDIKYRYFFENLLPYVITDKYILVHAGLNFSNKDPLEDENSMRWIRSWYDDIRYVWLNGRFIIHGHTPIPVQSIQNLLHKIYETRVLNLDNGCVYYNEKGFGSLCALELETHTLYFEECID
jgi:serine/threonine protein phosphatase 1